MNRPLRSRSEQLQLAGRVNDLHIPDELAKLSVGELNAEQLLALLDSTSEGGIRLTFTGKPVARQIARRVRPRTLTTVDRLGYGTADQASQNLLIEGDNLQAMVTLYRYRGHVDLILTDPPYNTGKDFRYNDKWDEDPNDDGIGDLVDVDDVARHTKWLKFMWPRLQMMKAMLKPGGVLAICIDERELFRLGVMLDELFDGNRLAIINWQKASAPKNDKSHVASTTEYVLVYAKDASRSRTQRLDRDETSFARYKNPDDDPKGRWREHDLTARTPVAKDQYGIQSPFSGDIHYPSGTRSWAHPKRNIKQWLEEWGPAYEERDDHDPIRVKIRLRLHTKVDARTRTR